MLSTLPCWNSCSCLRNDGVNVAQLLVNHKSEDTHLGGTAVVELDGTLLELGFIIKRVPAKVEVSVSEVTREFSSGDVL